MRSAVLAAVLLASTDSWRPAAPPIIVSALLTSDGILFASPIVLPWDSLLPSSLRPAALAADPGRRRHLFNKRSDFGSTEVPFSLPLPADLRRRTYYLLDSAGTRELRPTGLLGTARITWAGDRDSVEAVKADELAAMHHESHEQC